MDDKKLSFEEFELYYESTEKVTDRRLETNRWNYSICLAVLVAIAALIRWGLTTTSLLWVGFAGAGVLSVMAFLFCLLWIGQIKDFKKLNNAKFAVLNAMAPNLDFDFDKPGAVVSYCPFEKEWARLAELSALEKIGKANIVALKSSNIEYFIPKAFCVLFVGIFAALIVVVASNWPPTTLIAPPQIGTSPSQVRSH